MHRLISLVIFCGVITVADHAGAATIYRWRGPDGSLQFSNRPEVIPDGAVEVTLPPLRERASSVTAGVPVTAPVAPPAPQRARRMTVATCPAPDASGLADAVATRLGQRQLDGLTLIVGGIPVSHNSDARIGIKEADVNAGVGSATEQAAIAYPAGAPCPSRPPLDRYLVTNGHAPSRRLCDDYRRAFAEVGVAVNRDQGVARSFHDVAEEFVRVAGHDYTAGGRGAVIVQSDALTPIAYGIEERVPLPPWVVEAHIAQTRELAAESGHFVDELTVALEEIDAAARRAGCW